ncbi:DUF3987 domain-containing protein [Desulfovibrio sulfodismutans]|uniref:DUF3987 domain-containing protein n=1 Tax=Desulfolutivibrio sulfodismutans TaxID=63561 RepID=A0A7K3NG91_9BACT|nr:DUF3987 domain-containing protein [Desulfolutivibrio sulfodismutans]NDY55202.1 DUF3987 domain-containing protein [Desulfolutivibrio sulfodismutans]QLA12167.1 DUF3987 domain-containing protein [Desulfolutivibrio sulfodismutans DSM 3696]
MDTKIVSAFREELKSGGLVLDEIIADGKLHRCGTVGKERGKDGAYVLHADPPMSGWWQNYRTGESGKWTDRHLHPMSITEKDRLQTSVAVAQNARREESSRLHAKAKETAFRIWEKADPVPLNHPYLARKGVMPLGDIRMAHDGRLIVPLLDNVGAIMSLQFIAACGEKRFLAGGATSGGRFTIPGDDGPLCIAEGYATGASIHEATKHTVLVAFHCGNLMSVATSARQTYPDRQIILCADNDHETERARGRNPGVAHATEAARAVSGLLAIPRFKVPDSATDLNDLARTEGLDAVRNCIMAAVPVLPEVDVQAAGPSPVRFENENSPDIPARLFPGILGKFCSALAEELQVPFELPLCSALGTIAVAVQRKCRVRVKDGYAEPLNIFALCPLPPGERKSATVEACKKPLVEWQTDRSREMQDGIREAASERRTLEKAIDMKRASIGKAKTAQQRKDLIQEIKAMEKELPDVPRAPRLLADDFTPEALALLMERHEQRIGLLEAEGGLFDTLAGRYSNGVPNLDAVLKSWSGETCQIDRRGAETIILNDPHLTLVISPQPEVVQALAGQPGFRGRGLVGRFLYFMPRSRLGTRSLDSSPMPESIARKWKQTIQNLLSIVWNRDTRGNSVAYDVPLSPEALNLWRKFAQDVESALLPGGTLEHMTDWGGKYPGQAIRLAGLMHMATAPEPLTEPLSPQTMENALTAATILAAHATAAYGLMGSDPQLECAQSILKWIERDRVSSFTARDAMGKVKGRYPTMDKVNAGLAILEERAFIFSASQDTRKGPGRRPSAVYTVNPHTFE